MEFLATITMGLGHNRTPIVLGVYLLASMTAALAFSLIALCLLLRPRFDIRTVPNCMALYGTLIALVALELVGRAVTLMIGPNVLEMILLAGLAGASAVTAYFTALARSGRCQ
jgi:hypothetical protein